MAFLQHIFAHLQNLVGLVTMGLLLMLLAAISYPFQPREPLLLFSWVAILTSVVVTLFIFVSANRDKTLSLLTGKAPGKVNSHARSRVPRPDPRRGPGDRAAGRPIPGSRAPDIFVAERF